MSPQTIQSEAAAYALVVAGSPEPSSPQLVRMLAKDASLVVAVDRGLDSCYAAKLLPQLLVGDEDSASAEALAWAHAAQLEELVFPREKYATDLSHALDELVARGVTKFVLTCISGGRPDHALAILGLLATHADCAPQVYEDEFELRILSPRGVSSWQLGSEDSSKTFSFVPLEPAIVSIHGMHWELDHRDVAALSDLGISNVVDGRAASVSVHQGCVAAWLHKDGSVPHI